jgi:hypothetical protein
MPGWRFVARRTRKLIATSHSIRTTGPSTNLPNMRPYFTMTLY